MVPINLGELESVHKEIREAAKCIGSRVTEASTSDNFNINAQEERELLEETIDVLNNNHAHLVKLRTRLNALVPINRLPVEVFSLIILFTGPPSFFGPNTYLRCTWVCHHWRLVLIQDSRFWTYITHKRHGPQEVHDELVRRSKSAKLDVVLQEHTGQYSTDIQPLFSSASSRIHGLFISDATLRRINFSNISFSSLRILVVCDFYDNNGFSALLPALATTKCLERLKCEIEDDDNINMNQLASVFNRTKILEITLLSESTSSFVQSILALLHNNAVLQKLALYTDLDYGGGSDDDNIITLPGLQDFMTDHPDAIRRIRTPKLSSLVAISEPSPDARGYVILENFDFASIKYLYVEGTCRTTDDPCISGSMESPDCSGIEPADAPFESSFNFPKPKPHFHITIHGSLKNELQVILSETLSRSMNLIELRLSVHYKLYDLRKVLTQARPVERLTVNRGDRLRNFIHILNDNTLLCNLKELFYSPAVAPTDLDSYNKETGKRLTKCLKSRVKSCVHQLHSITLHDCPTLPERWLEELKSLGTTVITHLPELKPRTAGK